MTDATPTSIPVGVTRSALSDGEWHRLHPLTPVLRGGLFLVIVLGIVIANLRERLVFIFLPGLAPELGEWEEDWSSGDPIDWVIANNLYLLALAVVLGVVLLLILWFYVSWRFHTFRITGDDVEVRSGILFRTHRRAPLDRVQGVNLTRPMIARLVGMAKLEVVGAGIDGNVKLEYLSTKNAETVRADILRLASGRRLAEGASGGPAGSVGLRGRAAALGETVTHGITGLVEGDDTAHSEPASVVRIPVGRLVASRVLSGTTVALLALIVGAIVLSVTGRPWALFGLVPAVFGFGAYWVNSLIRNLRYSIAPTDGGVRITFGLFTTITEIVPPGRIHAVQLSQPLLWRPAGWWTIRINRLSGRSVSGSAADSFTTVLPVGTLDDAQRVLALMLPSTSDEERAVLVQEGAIGTGEAGGFTTTPPRARLLRPLSWRRNGFRLTQSALVLRRGFVWRAVTALPLARLQSVSISQGPIRRLVRVASIQGQVVLGPVETALGAIDRDAALAVFAQVARASAEASAADRSHRWAADDERGGGGAAHDGEPGGDGVGTGVPGGVERGADGATP